MAERDSKSLIEKMKYGKNRGFLQLTLGGKERNVKSEEIAYTLWVWPEIKRGDCTIAAGASYRLYENGVTHWECDISSTDSGDEWRGSFAIQDAAGVYLILIDFEYHFDIHDANAWKHWVQDLGPDKVELIDGVSLADAFARAQILEFWCRC
jgi:hypothetical protein